MRTAGDHPGKGLLFAAALALSAIFMALAIESPRHWWLGWVTLLPLLQAVKSLAPSWAGAAGAFWGASVFLVSLLLGSSGIEGTPASFAVLTLGPALYAGLGAVLTRRVGFSPYLLALGWVGVEFCLRPVGLEHGLLAGTQGDGLLIRVVGSFAGYVLVAFVVAYINASLLSVLHEVSGCLSGVRLIAGSAGALRRLVISETPFLPSYALCVSQPRAPPFSN